MHSAGDSNNGGPAIILSNKSDKPCTYFFYENFWYVLIPHFGKSTVAYTYRNGKGTAGANFTHPLESTTVAPQGTTFVSLAAIFKGSLQRGTTLLATWAEFQLDVSNDHRAHGDIGLEQGCDEAATISSTDGSRRSNGFTEDVFEDAPEAAAAKNPDGSRALASTMGDWMGGPDQAAIEYESRVLGQEKVYITGGTGVPDLASRNQVLAVAFY